MGETVSQHEDEHSVNQAETQLPKNIHKLNEEYINQFEIDEKHEFYSIENEPYIVDEKQESSYSTSRFDKSNSSRSTKQNTIKGLTRKKIQRFMEHGGHLVNPTSSHRRIIDGRAMERSYQVSTIEIIGHSQDKSKVKIESTVKSQTDENKEYKVSIYLQKCIINNGKVQIKTTQNIESSYCTCSDTYGDFVDDHKLKKCKHICGTLEGVREEHKLDLTVKTGKNEVFYKDPNVSDEHPFYHIGNVKLPIARLPKSFPGPRNAFNFGKTAHIMKWLTDDDYSKSNLAAMLVWMYIGNGAINSYAHLCPHTSCTIGEMKLNLDTLQWTCRGRHKVLDHETNIIKTVPHKTTIPLFRNSSMFEGFIKPNQLANWTALVFLYLDPWTAVKQMPDKLIGLTTSIAYKWGAKLRWSILQIRKRIPIKLGDNGSSIEIDNSFLNGEWKYKKMSMPHNWHVRSWNRIIERFFTEKGRHRRLTFLVGVESIDHCLPLLLANVARNRSIPLYADGSKMCEGIANRVPVTDLVVSQCEHSSSHMVKLGTEHLDAHGKAHDNHAETSFQRDKLVTKSRYGLGGVEIDLAESWIGESDWAENYTNMTTIDKGKTYIEQICEIFPAKPPKHLWI
eukprot:532422_1